MFRISETPKLSNKGIFMLLLIVENGEAIHKIFNYI